MLRVSQITAGVILGLLCWNFLRVCVERQENRVKHERLMQAVDEYQDKCDKGDTDACHQAIELLTQDSH